MINLKPEPGEGVGSFPGDAAGWIRLATEINPEGPLLSSRHFSWFPAREGSSGNAHGRSAQRQHAGTGWSLKMAVCCETDPRPIGQAGSQPAMEALGLALPFPSEGGAFISLVPYHTASR